MGAMTELDPEKAIADGMHEYQEFLESQHPEDVALEESTGGMPIQHIRPIEVESRHQAGLLLAGLTCGITTEMQAIVGVFMRLYGVHDIAAAVDGVMGPQAPNPNAMQQLQEAASAASVGIGLYGERELAQLVVHFITDEDRAMLAASLMSVHP